MGKKSILETASHAAMEDSMCDIHSETAIQGILIRCKTRQTHIQQSCYSAMVMFLHLWLRLQAYLISSSPNQ